MLAVIYVPSIFEPDVVYRPQNNPLLDMLIYRCRATIYANQIDHDDMRGLIRHLKKWPCNLVQS